MSYATVADLTEKYPAIAKSTGLDTPALSKRLTAASAVVNTHLSRRYPLPIDPAPQLLKDIEMDLAWAQIMTRPYQGGQVPDDINVAYQVRREAMRMLRDIAGGTMDLLDDDGQPVPTKASQAIYSNTRGLTPAFDLGDPEGWREPEERRRHT